MSDTEIIPAISRAEIIEALAPLLRSMPAKGKVQDRMEGYFLALASFTRVEIEAGVRKFMSGECDGIKTEFVPPPPQLAQIVREAAGLKQALAKREQVPTLYGYKRPRSQIIARNITKDQVREGRGGGIYPSGCIWCPAPLGQNQDFGDLYSPDPDWQGSKPINQPHNEEPYSGPVRQAPIFGTNSFRDFTQPKQDEEELPLEQPSPIIHDYSKETEIEVSEHLLKQLNQHKETDAEFDQQFPPEEGPNP